MKTGAVIAAGAGTPSAGASGRAGTQNSFGHTVDFGEQYYTNMLCILESIRRTEMERVGDLTGRMAATLKKGGAVWWQAKAGHMPLYEFREENRGNPHLFRTWLRPGSGGDYENMKPGDVLVTNYVHPDIRAARDKGVHVVGVPVNYVDNEWAPRGFVTPNENGWLLGDVSNEILQSYIPYTQGIVDCPQIPEMRICPSSANSLGALFWMHQAETANKLKNPKAKSLDKSVEFMDTLIGRIREAYSRHKGLLFDHAPAVAQRIGNGAHIHITSDHQGVEVEATVVAMGPMMFNAFRKEMKRGDVHILTAIDPDTKAILAEAKRARDMGMFVVSIAPGSSTELRRLSDVFVDNLSPEGQGFFPIPGYPEKIAVMGGIMNNVLFWIFSAQIIDEMVLRGWVPYFWMGIYTAGGSEYNAAMQPFFRKRGF
ncbi:MAG: phosphoheptose isomerase family protein [Candidatus Latescibacterota bacterium]